MKLDQNVCIDKASDNSKMGYVGSKTRSVGKILEKRFIRSRGHILRLIILNVGQNVCLDKILDEFKNGSWQDKN